MSLDFEKIAAEFAAQAVSVKQANGLMSQESLGMGLAGAGLGALLGATSRKNKLRNALMYGLGGGVAGMGAGALLRGHNAQQAVENAAAAQRKQEEAAAAAATASPKTFWTGTKYKSNPTFWDDYKRTLSRYVSPWNQDTSGAEGKDRGAVDDALKWSTRASLGTGAAAGTAAATIAAPGATIGATGRAVGYGGLGAGLYGGGTALADAIAEAAKINAQNQQ